jgi:hypothetical protein
MININKHIRLALRGLHNTDVCSGKYTTIRRSSVNATTIQ